MTLDLDYKALPLEVKQVDRERSQFEGYSAGIGNVDEHDDRILPGAFARTIRERVAARAVKLLDQHSTESTQRVWGTVNEAAEEEVPSGQRKKDGPTHRVWTLFDVSRADPAAQIALGKVEEGHLDALSIGYKPMDVGFVLKEMQKPRRRKEGENPTRPMTDEELRWEWLMGRAIREIKELAWWESSLVIWGANHAATVVPGSVKALGALVEASAGRDDVAWPQIEEALFTMKRLAERPNTSAARELLRRLGSAFAGRAESVVQAGEGLGVFEPDELERMVAIYEDFAGAVKDATPQVFVATVEALADVDEVAAPVEGKPFPNEHACRLRDPGAFEPGSFRRTRRRHEGKGYSVILGRLKGETSLTEQAYRYPKESWEVAAARSHCRSHGGKRFEAARAEAAAELASGPGTAIGSVEVTAPPTGGTAATPVTANTPHEVARVAAPPPDGDEDGRSETRQATSEDDLDYEAEFLALEKLRLATLRDSLERETNVHT